MAAKQRLAELVAQHAPVLYMHPHDHFMPCTVEWFSEWPRFHPATCPGLRLDASHAIARP